MLCLPAVNLQEYRKTMAGSGADFHWYQGGRGAPVLYLHGALGDEWMAFHDYLAEEFTVIRPDHPGWGPTDLPDWLMAIEDLVYAYLDFFDDQGWDRIPIIGLSMGGWLAAELAVHSPERVEKLVLIDAVGLEVPGAPIVDIFTMSPRQLMKEVFYNQDLAEEAIPENLSDTDLVLTQAHNRQAAARVGWNPLMANPQLRRRLYRITAPTLILWGEHDRLVPRAHAEAYLRGIPNAKLEIIPSCGHSPTREKPRETAERIIRFLKEAI